MIIITAFFVAGEFSLVAVSRSRVDARAAKGDQKAVRLRRSLKDLSFELSGAQLGITVTSLIVGAITEPSVSKLVQPVLASIGIESVGAAVAVTIALATIAQMVFGELFPKNVAIARPYPTALRVGLPMSYVNNAIRPVIVFFNKSANWTVRRLGMEPSNELAGIRSLGELEAIIRASSAEGQLEAHETSLLTRAITFVEKIAADAMIPRINVVGIPATATISDLRRLSVETGHSRFPVFETDLDAVTGVVHVKDTFRATPEERDRVLVTSIAVPAEVVPESMNLDTLLVRLQRNGRSMALVVDEYGGTAGIVTIEDLVEEILGDIEDEHDATGARIADLAPGMIPGTFHRHEVEELTGFEWPEGGYETLNGFVTAELDRFPRPGDVVRVGEFEIVVVSTSGHIADRLAIRNITNQEQP